MNGIRALPVFLLAATLQAQDLGTWDFRAPYPLAVTEVSAAAIDGKVFATCGFLANGSTNQLFVFDPVQESWTVGASLPIPGGANHCNLAAANNKLYFLGGIGANGVAGETYEYDPSLDQWRQVGRMPTPRGASGVAAIGNKIYVAGGEGQAGAGAAFEAFDTVSGQWESLPALPTPRTHLTAKAVNNRFYAISGRTAGIGQVLAANEEYDPATNSWRSRAPIPTPRGGLASGAANGRIQVFGGEGPSGQPGSTYQENEEYDPDTNSWRALSPIPTRRHGFYGATLVEPDGRGRVFLPGGGPQAGLTVSSVHEVFHPFPVDPPRFLPENVVNAADFQQLVAPGSLASLFGTNLSAGAQAATTLPLPTTLNTVEIEINGRGAPLIFVSSGQINFQVPFDSGRNPAISVSYAGAESDTLALQLADLSPAIFTLTQDGSGQGAVLVGGTGMVAGPQSMPDARPVATGEAIEIYCVGLGDVSNPPAPGVPAPVQPLAHVSAAITATIEGIEIPVFFAGLAPGLVGVYQVNALITPETPQGDNLNLLIKANQALSNTVQVSVNPVSANPNLNPP